ncbi:hypothetical protein [Salinisphaera sp. T31B1]|uniref:PRC-barrel domain-containing protein n=1 Tax=Salinisphaera sp. T31B1 TaxID=727963 RepID=UPI00333E2922
MSIRKTTTTGLIGIALAASTSMAFAAQPEGVYSADRLMDADVYVSGSNDAVGEVEDVILDNNMQIKSFIVETEGKFGLGGKSYVVSPDQLSVETLSGDKPTEPNYRVTLNADASQLSGYPVYNDAWWNNTQSQASDAWQQTKESASDAWTRIKKGTNDLIDRAQGETSDAADATGDAVDNAADNTQDAADDATH